MEHASTANGKLPRELLELIFKNLCPTIEDRDSDPGQLDRLLLVCRFWTMVALDYRHLWSSIFIILKREPDYAFWTSYARTRLQRAGPTEPLQIKLITRGLYNQTDQDEEMKILLSILTGSTGEVAQRWRQLVCVSTKPTTKRIYDHFFSFPTPKLEILIINGVSILQTYQFLPDTPSLSELRLAWCNIPHIKDLSSLICLDITMSGNAANLLEQATRLERYKYTHLRDWELTRTIHLPRLLHLEIMAPFFSGSLNRLTAPNLVGLRIHLPRSDHISWVFNAPGIPLRALRELDLYSCLMDEQLDKGELRKLLLATPNLKKLSSGQPNIAVLLLCLLLDMDNLHQAAPGLLFGCLNDTALLGVGEERQKTIMRLLEIIKEKYKHLLYISV
ncbi:SubName: Full=Uncharacterized protein {ECO:0000313/EMBL:CCA70390.1} [Serendipita indica DSM 11827]|nr:SubName: Full=Uncharacterized protein {ECO:0000313/EMBL:CCA70390.1} [Serendipita indica DSM 11827]